MICLLFTRLIDEGGDWDRRNRLKVYRGLYTMSIRDFKSAAKLFLDTIATFTSYELMDYQHFVTYTVLCCIIALERTQLREKVRVLFLSIFLFVWFSFFLSCSKFLDNVSQRKILQFFV